MKRKRLAAGVATDLTDRYVLFHEQRTWSNTCQILMIKSVASP